MASVLSSFTDERYPGQVLARRAPSLARGSRIGARKHICFVPRMHRQALIRRSPHRRRPWSPKPAFCNRQVSAEVLDCLLEPPRDLRGSQGRMRPRWAQRMALIYHPECARTKTQRPNNCALPIPLDASNQAPRPTAGQWHEHGRENSRSSCHGVSG